MGGAGKAGTTTTTASAVEPRADRGAVPERRLLRRSARRPSPVARRRCPPPAARRPKNSASRSAPVPGRPTMRAPRPKTRTCSRRRTACGIPSPVTWASRVGPMFPKAHLARHTPTPPADRCSVGCAGTASCGRPRPRRTAHDATPCRRRRRVEAVRATPVAAACSTSGTADGTAAVGRGASGGCCAALLRPRSRHPSSTSRHGTRLRRQCNGGLLGLRAPHRPRPHGGRSLRPAAPPLPGRQSRSPRRRPLRPRTGHRALAPVTAPPGSLLNRRGLSRVGPPGNTAGPGLRTKSPRRTPQHLCALGSRAQVCGPRRRRTGAREGGERRGKRPTRGDQAAREA